MRTLEPPVLVPLRIPTIGLPWYEQLHNIFRNRRFVLYRNFYFYDSFGMLRMIPDGYGIDGPYRYHFSTDGTSYPKLLQWLFDRMGIGITAAISHDFATRYQCFLNEDGSIGRRFETREASDLEFYLIDTQVNQMQWLSWIKWQALRIGSRSAWNRYRNMPEDQTNPHNLMKP